MSERYRFDPELAEAAARLTAPDLDDLSAARLPRRAHSLDTPPDVAARDHAVEVPGRADPLLVRLFRPAVSAGDLPCPDLPCLVQLHAGGFVLGSIAQDHQRNVALSRELGAVVVSVDYRLAPEHPYPAALDDCYAALEWVRGSAARLGVAEDRVAIHGRSAGAGLAVATALRARDRRGPMIRFLYLGIPQLDDRLTTASVRRFVDTPMWTRRNAEISWRTYLGGENASGPDDDRRGVGIDHYAVPARAVDLSGLPPVYVSAMEFDPLRDEAIAFASALLTAGVTTELHVFPGTFHGSATLVPDAEISRRERAEELGVLRRALAAGECSED